MGRAKLLGVQKITNKLGRYIDNYIPVATARGAVLIADYLYSDMLHTSPTIPKDTGDLRRSWYARIGEVSSTRTRLVMGFRMKYSLLVHEDTETPKNWTEPGSGPKFFESALNRNYKKMIDIMKDEVKKTL